MRKSKLAISAVPVAAVLALGVQWGPAAHASTSAVPTYTTAGVAAAAGWNVRSSSVDFTHTQGRYGSAGNASWENLPVASSLASVTAGTNITSQVNGGAIGGGIGQELCDTSQGSPGYAAQEGIVQVASGQFDVIESIGYFGPTALNSNGDVCDNGLLGVAQGSHVVESKVLLTGVHANDTVDMNTLYNARTKYNVFYNGHNYAVTKGHITFSADDLVTGGIGFDDSIAGAFISSSFTTNEAAQGVVSDTAKAPALTNVAVPAPNGGILEHTAPSELIRVAHSAVAGNSTAVGGHEVQGSFFTNSAWTATPVASTKDGTAGSALYLDPSAVAADNFYVAGGIGLVG
jgi:hypothetical protein